MKPLQRKPAKNIPRCSVLTDLIFSYWSLDISLGNIISIWLLFLFVKLNATHSLSLLIVRQTEDSQDDQICWEMFWWHHRLNHFWHNAMTFWQIFLCHQFSIYIGFSSESISNAFLQTLCHQLWHHGDLYKTPTIPTQSTQEHCDILRCALFIWPTNHTHFMWNLSGQTLSWQSVEEEKQGKECEELQMLEMCLAKHLIHTI